MADHGVNGTKTNGASANGTGANGAGGGKKVTLQVWRGDKTGGAFETYQVETYPGMVVLDAIHDIQAKQEPNLVQIAAR